MTIVARWLAAGLAALAALAMAATAPAQAAQAAQAADAQREEDEYFYNGEIAASIDRWER